MLNPLGRTVLTLLAGTLIRKSLQASLKPQTVNKNHGGGSSQSSHSSRGRKMTHSSGWFFYPDDNSGYHFLYHPDTKVVNMIDEESDDVDSDVVKSWDDCEFDSLEEFEGFCAEKLTEETD